MTEPITYIDRQTKKICQEQVYGGSFLKLLYGKGWLTTLIGHPLAKLIAACPLFSTLYGYLQRTPSSKKKILPFIKKFGIDTSEFADNPSSFTSFNDFFIRKLKPAARPIDNDPATAIIPADGRYLFFQDISKADGFLVKGKKFSLETLLKDPALADKYADGSMAIARLCPTDYHRFHFPIDCTPTKTELINGLLYSVNPIALKRNIDIFTENKRTLSTLHSEQFQNPLFLEIGATFVGAITQTYTPDNPAKKGDEKGFFSFGGSSLILLFQKGTIIFDQDLLDASSQRLEIKCLMGQPMGRNFKWLISFS